MLISSQTFEKHFWERSGDQIELVAQKVIGNIENIYFIL